MEILKTSAVCITTNHIVTWDPEVLKKIKADPSLDKRNEELAENFAAGLLMPAEDLKDDAKKLISEIHRESLSQGSSIKYSEKLVRLAFSAYQKDKISKARLAQIVGVSLIDLPNLLAVYELNEPIQT